MPIPFIDALKQMLDRGYCDENISDVKITIAENLKTTIIYKCVDSANQIKAIERTFVSPKLIWNSFDQIKDGYSLDQFHVAIREYAKTCNWSKAAVNQVLLALKEYHE